MARRLSAVKDAKARPEPPDLRDAVDVAVAAMPWKEGTDEAMVALAKRMAAQIQGSIDLAVEHEALWQLADGDKGVLERLRRLETLCDVTKTVGWLGPQLQGVLKELGGSPQARRAMQVTSPVGGALASIRAGLPTGARGAVGENDPKDLDPAPS